MGCSYYAHTVIGCKIPEEKFLTEIIIKAFDHEYPETMKFCPQTGKKLWKTHKVNVINKEEIYLEKLDDLDCRIISDYGWGDRPTTYEIYIGIIINTSDEGSKFRILPKQRNLDYIQSALEKYNLWDESTFGLWTILEVNC